MQKKCIKRGMLSSLDVFERRCWLMNTSYKCNCCCKEDVCKYKDEYISDCNRIKSQVNASRITEVSIKCTKFQANQVNMRGADNG